MAVECYVLLMNGQRSQPNEHVTYTILELREFPQMQQLRFSTVRIVSQLMSISLQEELKESCLPIVVLMPAIHSILKVESCTGYILCIKGSLSHRIHGEFP